MGITLRQLQVFHKVVSSGHATRASEEMGVTQSAVSMAIAELEKAAGAPLFERRGRKLLLNERGRHIFPEVDEVLRKVSEIERYLQDSVGEPVGVLKIGASTTIGNYLLPLILGAFEARYPRAKAQLEVHNSRHIELAVEAGEYDVGLIEGPAHIPILSATPWRDDELVVVVGREHPLARIGSATADELKDANWVMREEGSGTREIFETAMASAGISCNISMVLGHTEAIKKAVEAGLGLGCLSRLAVQRELDHRWLVQIQTPLELRRDLCIITREIDYTSRLLSAYLSLLHEGR